MPPDTRWRSQPTMGSEVRAVVPARPAVPPLIDLDRLDWDTIITVRQNVLLYGAPSALDAVLAALRPYLCEPIHRWAPHTEPCLPHFVAGTLVLEQATACQQVQQQALWEWLNEADRRVQVITTTDQPLFDLVERGDFLASLYYRLNTLYLDVSCST